MKTLKLTQMEIQILNAMRYNEYNDCLQDHCGTWTFSVIENAGIDPKKARGVISSLLKKGLVEVNEKTSSDPESIGYTEAGEKLFETATGKENSGWGGPRLLEELTPVQPEEADQEDQEETKPYTKSVIEKVEEGKKVKTERFVGEGWNYTRITTNNFFTAAKLTVKGKDIKLKTPSKKAASLVLTDTFKTDIVLK